jgi:hypothetical protein
MGSYEAHVRPRALNHPASGKAGIARLFASEHHCPGLPEPERSAMIISNATL